MKTPQGLAELSRSLEEAAIKVVLVVVGDTGLENIRHLASGDKFIVTVGSPDRLKVMVQQTVDKIIQGNVAVWNRQLNRRRWQPLFPFRKRSLPFLTVDTTVGNQRFRHDRCNIFPGLSYNKAHITFRNSRRKNDVGNEVEFTC